MLRLLSVCAALALAGWALAREPAASEQRDAGAAAQRAISDADKHSEGSQFAEDLKKSRRAMESTAPAVSPNFELPDFGSPALALPDDASLSRTWALSENAQATPPLLVLVSFSMPTDTLNALAEQAGKIGAPLVLRGLVGDSMEETAKRIAALRKSAGTSLAIDPTLFTRFGVDRVPTVVLPLQALRSCSEQECSVPEHVKVAGEASLDYLLGQIERKAHEPAARTRAAALRKQMEAQ
ncbi:MAG: type-F conjugative transfer system pilin assembly protein TrbC [Nevskiaceae bacterium]|nr:MAG: type-F conjugative transfer system pilin assembly protein TrbC [Nevskiaceae bacterium]